MPDGRKNPLEPRPNGGVSKRSATRNRFDSIFMRLLFLSEGLSADKPRIKKKGEKMGGVVYLNYFTALTMVWDSMWDYKTIFSEGKMNILLEGDVFTVAKSYHFKQWLYYYKLL